MLNNDNPQSAATAVSLPRPKKSANYYFIMAMVVGAAVGVNDMARVEKLIAANVDVLGVDTAHGHSIQVARAVERVKRESNRIQVIAGNVATYDAARALIDAGHSPAPTLVSTDCSCSARTERCVHVLAVLYTIARQVDENPRLALELQGFFDATTEDGVSTQVPRWTSINSLDPSQFFARTP